MPQHPHPTSVFRSRTRRWHDAVHPPIGNGHTDTRTHLRYLTKMITAVCPCVRVSTQFARRRPRAQQGCHFIQQTLDVVVGFDYLVQETIGSRAPSSACGFCAAMRFIIAATLIVIADHSSVLGLRLLLFPTTCATRGSSCACWLQSVETGSW
jgi:hypothetical protein